MLYAILFTILCVFLTCVGAGVVFIIGKPSLKLIAFLNSFSAGVMISSSIFSLILPSINYCEELGLKAWIILPCCFVLAHFMFYCLNKLQRDKHDKNNKSLMISIALHNIPEGMCVGFAFANAMLLNTNEALIIAIMVAIGIGVQNIPEGSSLSFPLYANGHSKIKSFLISTLVGSIEFPAGMIAFVIGLSVIKILPFMLAFSSAVMIFVACVDLMPDAAINNKKIASFGIFLGFTIMMLLDLALG